VHLVDFYYKNEGNVLTLVLQGTFRFHVTDVLCSV